MKVLKGIGGFFKKHLKLVIVLAIIAVIVGFVWHNMQVAKKAIEEAANEPVTSEIKKMDLQRSVAVTGTLTANDKATVQSIIVAKNRIQGIERGDKKVVMYVSAKVYDMMELFLMDKTNVYITRQELMNKPPQLYFAGIPVKLCDAIAENEGAVS